MKKSDKRKKQNGDVTVNIPHHLCYRRYGKTIEKTIQIKYGIPRDIVQDNDISSLAVSGEMAAVIYEAEREMKRAQKRASEWKIGSYVEGLSEIAMAYDSDEVQKKVENRFLCAEIAEALNQLRPKHRRRVIMFHFLGYTVKEISEEERKTMRAIRASLRIAEKKLAELLEKTSLFSSPTD